MNLENIFAEIERVDPEVYEKVNTRRKAMKGFAGLAGKVAVASLPIALGSMFKKAYGQGSSADIFAVLNYALTLEYLEAEFYTTALAQTGLISGGARTGIQTISAHETAHVNFLRTAITAAGGTPVAKPPFDFTAGNGSNNGPFKDWTTNYAIFLAMAQTFEDAGVRAYKGQANNAALMANNDVLTAALNIHSVEARHASYVRLLRRSAGADVKPWITGNQSGIGAPFGAAVQPVYNGEEATVQATVNISAINGLSISVDDASEAFDEPLTMAQVLAIVDPFIV